MECIDHCYQKVAQLAGDLSERGEQIKMLTGSNLVENMLGSDIARLAAGIVVASGPAKMPAPGSSEPLRHGEATLPGEWRIEGAEGEQLLSALKDFLAKREVEEGSGKPGLSLAPAMIRDLTAFKSLAESRPLKRLRGMEAEIDGDNKTFGGLVWAEKKAVRLQLAHLRAALAALFRWASAAAALRKASLEEISCRRRLIRFEEEKKWALQERCDHFYKKWRARKTPTGRIIATSRKRGPRKRCSRVFGRGHWRSGGR